MENSSSNIANGHQEHAQKPIHEERHVKVICVGAGASGLILAYKLQRSFQHFDLVIYEKNTSVGGTWFENRYPGCACDIPSHTYTFSFEPSAKWSSIYASSKEIAQYFNDFCDKYSLRRFCRFRHQVSKATWSPSCSQWEVEITDLETGATFVDTCDVFINGSGILNSWKWPSVPGLNSFKGKLLHTARWDENIDLANKRVGLIGNGSSAIQTLPHVVSTAKEVINFIRSPTWVAPIQRMKQREYTEEERTAFEKEPLVHLEYRRSQERMAISAFPMFLAGSPLQDHMRDMMTDMMKQGFNNEALEYLIPSFPVGCRRLTPGTNYLESLASDKVTVVRGGVEEITERGCICDGKEYAVDVLICATGFDTSFKPRFPLIGSGGRDLRDVWSEEPQSYFGFAAAGFPNYFVFLGPNSPVGNASVLPALEAQADYMLKFIDRWQTEGIQAFSPKEDAVREFVAFKDDYMERMVWTKGCPSWYQSPKTGKITALWPGSLVHYREALSEPRYEDWDIRYNGNRFHFLGNGFSQAELDTSGEQAYYIRNVDDGPPQSRSAQRRAKMQVTTVPVSDLASSIPSSKTAL